MSDYIDTREGWREVSAFEFQPHSAPKIAVMEDDGETRYWVREAPLTTLPNDPYTVIRATLDNGDEVDLIRAASGHWGTAYGYRKIWATDADIVRVNLVRSFQVLSEPSAITAKAVLGRLLNRLDAEGIKVTNIGEWIDMVGREFGVES